MLNKIYQLINNLTTPSHSIHEEGSSINLLTPIAPGHPHAGETRRRMSH